ncbi:DNA binding domain-containing protein, excisionase family [Candidatus Methylobacter favarea]|uniref:DNA binding domain-containing protein, excisionase family n=1 Tax=Candidatus Methylobacter favarea TaxID=2707345 RepID=A0A8S0XEQ7_9GAMM|nr:helix-turn-helix domain-containing protein [Candidatus Methylobacter favarea]CAA9889974.1 DNA binding domain-containing protein, excisionase family [Candidatus Methylobacter favarea]
MVTQNQNRTMDEAREWLRISQPTLYKLINENKLKTYKIGRRRFTTIQELENFVRQQEDEAQP